MEEKTITTPVEKSDKRPTIKPFITKQAKDALMKNFNKSASSIILRAKSSN